MQILKVLKNSNFNKLWLGQIVSYIGDQLTQMVLLGWLIATGHKTGSEMAYILFFSLLPSLLLGQWAGILADKFSRRLIMLFADIFRAIIIFAIAYFMMIGQINNSYIYLFAFGIGIGTALFYPSKLAIISNIVKPEQLQAANALSAISGKMATLIGTYLAGLLIANLGLQTGLIIDGFSFLISAIFIFSLNVATKAYTQANSAENSFKQNFKFAWTYLQKHQKTKDLILLSALLSLLSSMFYVALTSTATDYFKLGVLGIGKLHAMLGCGMIIGALLAIKLSEWFKARNLIVLCFVIILATTATSHFVNSYNLAWFWLITLGAGNAILVITLDTLLQKIVPDRFRGKVFGFRSVFNNIAFLSSLLFCGWLLNFSSAFAIFKLMASISFLTALGILMFNSSLPYFILRAVLKPILKTCFLLKVEGKQYLRYGGRVVLAGNHTGWLDGLILGAAFKRPICFLVAQEVFYWPIVGKMLKNLGFIPVLDGQGKQALNDAIQRLNRGKATCIFPEGKLTQNGQIQKFNRGVARLHKLSGAPILPFAIEGGFEAWAWNQKWPKFHKIKIKFGEPIINYAGSELELLAELKKRVENLKDNLKQ